MHAHARSPRRDELDEHRGLLPRAQPRRGRRASAATTRPGSSSHSVDFDPVVRAQHDGDWDARDGGARPMPPAGSGAAAREALLLATNTMHKVADAVRGGRGRAAAPHRRPDRGRPARRRARRAWRCSRPGSPWSRTSTPVGCASGASTCSSPRRRTARPCTASSTTSWSTTSCARSRATAYLEVVDRLAERGADAVVLGLHRDRAAARPGRRRAAAVRHHRPARGGRGRLALRL